MRQLVFIFMAMVGFLAAPAVSSAGLIFLGSFANPPSGNDRPDEAVYAAILAATGIDFSATLERIYQNDDPAESGIAVDYFDVDFDASNKNRGTIQVTGNLSELDYEALFVTAKVGNAGFNLYTWQDGGPYEFFETFYENGTLTYDWPDVGEGTWSDGEETGTVIPPPSNPAVSHVSVWGAPSSEPHPFPGSVPEPASLLVWSLFGVLGIGWRIRSQSKA